jgi:DNA topoisomerase-1
MERKGIGRPSTFASTIATLKEREYVVLEKSALAPTALGLATDEALGKAIPDLVDCEFTARMEASLDAIADAKLDWQKYVTQWNAGYLEPALVKAREVLKTVAPVPGAVRSARPASRGEGGGASDGAARAGNAERIQAATLKAQKAGTQPECPKGHGKLVLRLSKRDSFYWKCLFPECDSVSWWVELSREKCPACSAALEKIPSKKVSGGYFLKCRGRPAPHDEVLFFRNRKTKEWEQAKGPRATAPAPSAPPQ